MTAARSSLKVGDRVRVYGTDKNGNLVSGVGEIESFAEEGQPLFRDVENTTLFVKGKQGYDLTMPHPKQCRRLVKKRRRRVFVSFQKTGPPINDEFPDQVYVVRMPFTKEFEEVKSSPQLKTKGGRSAVERKRA